MNDIYELSVKIKIYMELFNRYSSRFEKIPQLKESLEQLYNYFKCDPFSNEIISILQEENYTKEEIEKLWWRN